MDPELKAYLDGMRGEIVTHMTELNTETRAEAHEHAEHLHAQAIEHAEQRHIEARILIEAVRDDVRIVANGVAMLNGKIDRIAGDHEERIQNLERRVP